MKIVGFILDRIAEDERLAEGALDHLPQAAVDQGEEAADPIALFVGRWNPWHVLSLCVLRRQAVMAHRPLLDAADHLSCSTCEDDRGAAAWPCTTMLLLANEWVDHPQFRPEWTLYRRRTLAAV